ncbi:hypothetical protein DD829_05565 [Chryseobacterium sp. HMWF035]|nr:hypothetical protein DBR25_17970 [Chryseobacterium sp. HMWF001]PVV59773.1 hypothetical protein DD829_05565 [Chryseobacterium sp. HMWF035]
MFKKSPGNQKQSFYLNNLNSSTKILTVKKIDFSFVEMTGEHLAIVFIREKTFVKFVFKKSPGN